MIEEIKWGTKKEEEERTFPHPHYEQNLWQAELFIKNISGELLQGMQVKIANSDHIEKCILWVIWQSPREAKVGNYSYPIVLHQDRATFRKELNLAFNSTYTLAKKWIKSPL